MRYDVFLAFAKADSEEAERVTRRLRALKFRVRHDRKRAHTAPTAKDMRDLEAARCAVVLWSKHSCNDDGESDWVHAIAHDARAEADKLLQVGLDATVPDEPFSQDPRHDISGMTNRTTPEAFLRLVEELGERAGRRELVDWMKIPAKDTELQARWKERNPHDPLSQKGRAVSEAGAGSTGAEKARSQTRDPEPLPPATDAVAPDQSPSPSSGAPRETAAQGMPKAPVVRTIPERTENGAGVRPLNEPSNGGGHGGPQVLMILAGIAAMFVISYLVRSGQVQPSGMPAVANAIFTTCPPGTMPRSLMQVLEPSGDIIVDTDGDPEPPDEAADGAGDPG